MVEHTIQGLVLFQQLACQLGTDQGDSGHVVDSIAHQRLKVDYLVWPHAPIREQLLGIIMLVLANIKNGCVVGDQLTTVLVTSHQTTDTSALCRLGGDSREYVVGFVILDDENGNPQRLQNTLDVSDLRTQVLRHRVAIRFVFVEQIISKCLSAWMVKSTKEKIRFIVLQQIQNVAHKAVRCADGLAGRSGHVGHCVEYLIDQRMCIDNVDALPLEIVERLGRKN